MKSAIVLIVAAVLMTAGAAGAGHLVAEQAAPCLNLRSAPGGAAVTCLAPGVEVEMLRTASDWGKVRLSSGQEGWMALAYLAEVGAGDSATSFARSAVPATAPRSTPIYAPSRVPVGASEGSERTAMSLEAEVPTQRDIASLGGILYDQTDSPAGAGFASQMFDAANAIFDCRAADDFNVPVVDIQWDIAGLQVLGTYVSGAGTTPAINVEFFADGGGVPGASSCSYPGLMAGVDYIDNGFGDLTITLPSICSLPAGDYWVSVQADMDSTVGGQWLWAERSLSAGANFAWENPPDGFGTGCVTWTPAGGCGASAPDLLFALNGVQVPVELQSISVD